MENKILNNERRPPQAGTYKAIDSAGNESQQYFNGNNWESNTGHPIEYWFEPPDEPVQHTKKLNKKLFVLSGIAAMLAQGASSGLKEDQKW